MKKPLSLLIAFLLFITGISNINADEERVYNDPYDEIQSVKEYYSLDLDTKEEAKYKGYLGYERFVKNYDFSDVSGNNKKTALQLAAFNITKGRGNRIFSANDAIKNIELLTFMLRMLSLTDDIDKKIEEENPYTKKKRVYEMKLDAYFEKAKEINLIDKNSSLPYFQNAKREDIARVFTKASDIKSESKEDSFKHIKDRNEIRNENKEAVKTVVDLGIIRLDKNGRFNPAGSMRRGDFAYMLNSLLKKNEAALNVKKRYGLVIGFTKSYPSEGMHTDILLKNEENKVEKIRISNLKNGDNLSFPVFRQNLESAGNLKIGDEIEYIEKNSEVILATVLKPNYVKREILQTLSMQDDIEISQGRIVSNKEELINTDEKKEKKQILRVELDEDRVVDLVGHIDYKNTVNNEFLYSDNGNFKEISSLKKGDVVTVYTREDNVLFIIKGREKIVTVNGRISGVDKYSDKPSITVNTIDNKSVYLPIGKAPNFTVNGYISSLKDMIPGVYVSVSSVRGKAEYIRASSYQPPKGYIPSRGRIEFLVLKDKKNSSLRFRNSNDEFIVNNSTIIQKNSKEISLSEIRNGDYLKLYFDDINTKTPSKIVVESKRPEINKILRARISKINPHNARLSVTEPYFLKNASWSFDKSDYINGFKLADDIEIYRGARKITKDELSKDDRGKIAYMTIRNFSSSYEVSKLIVSSGKENTFNTNITKAGERKRVLETEDSPSMIYGRETIVVKDSRLVDSDAIKKGMRANIVSNYNKGIEEALVVDLSDEKTDDFSRVYFASIRHIHPYKLEIANYSSVRDNKLSLPLDTLKALKFTSDTKIYLQDSKKYISSEDLFQGNYQIRDAKKNEKKGLKKKRYYGVFYLAKDNTISAMRIRDKELIEYKAIDDKLKSESMINDELSKQYKEIVFTKGSIGSFERENKRVSLYDSYNFFNHQGTWKQNDSKVYFDLQNALIIKNDKEITFDELRLEDRISVIRSDDDALVVRVEN